MSLYLPPPEESIAQKAALWSLKAYLGEVLVVIVDR
jgi:hypothetical protein